MKNTRYAKTRRWRDDTHLDVDSVQRILARGHIHAAERNIMQALLYARYHVYLPWYKRAGNKSARTSARIVQACGRAVLGYLSVEATLLQDKIGSYLVNRWASWADRAVRARAPDT